MTTMRIQVHPDGTTSVRDRPEGLPVDGDALALARGSISMQLQQRAQRQLLSDPAALQAAREWLRLDEVQRLPGEKEPDNIQVYLLLNFRYPGGVSRFISEARPTAA